MNAHRTSKDWSKLLSAFERAGSTHVAFCASRGLNLGTFRQALYRARRTARATPKAIPMVTLDVTPSPRAARERDGGSSDIELVFADVVVRLPASTDVGAVASLIELLRSRC